jgi:hypothetical protein
MLGSSDKGMVYSNEFARRQLSSSVPLLDRPHLVEVAYWSGRRAGRSEDMVEAEPPPAGGDCTITMGNSKKQTIEPA